jgi:cell volume regulation protein A
MSDMVSSELTELTLDKDCPAAGKRIVDLDFPRSACIAVIKRNGSYIMPAGSTVLLAGDILVILAENSDTLAEVRSCLKEKDEENLSEPV